jgi:hypothetical protein
MATQDASKPRRRGLLGRRNLVVLVAAIASLVAGFTFLEAGYASFAAVLLVVGYCVLFPLAIAL